MTEQENKQIEKSFWTKLKKERKKYKSEIKFTKTGQVNIQPYLYILYKPWDDSDKANCKKFVRICNTFVRSAAGISKKFMRYFYVDNKIF